jgi:RNA polymerase sigma factor (sigma-70 family)
VNREQQSAVFERWINDHAAILHHAVNAFAEGSDRDDLMQEVLLSVWRAIPAFRGEAGPTTYLYRISHNAAMTWRRRQQKSRRAEEAFREAPSATRSNPQVDRLYEAIRAFPPLDRSLLLLYLDELSYREMAEIHGISESLVGVRLSRARTKLMEQMKEESNESE